MARRPQLQPRPLNRLLRRIDPNRPENNPRAVVPRPPPAPPAAVPVINDPNHPDFVIPRRPGRGNEQPAAPGEVVVNPPAQVAQVAGRGQPADNPVVEVEIPRRENVARRRAIDPDSDPSDDSGDDDDDDTLTGSDYETDEDGSTSSPSDSGSYTNSTWRPGGGVRHPNYVPDDAPTVGSAQNRPESWDALMAGPRDKTRALAMTFTQTIGFTDQQSWIIIKNIATSAEAFKDMTEPTLRSFCSQLAKSPGPERLDLSMTEVNTLIGFMHWVQDTFRMGQNEIMLKASYSLRYFQYNMIALAIHRARIREALIKDAAAKGKECSPGPLKSEKDWMKWIEKLIAFLDTQPGITGIPLSYVIRPMVECSKRDQSDATTSLDYLGMLVARAPLSGPVFSADSRTVHQLLTGFIVGQEAEHWIKGLSSQNDGRRDMEALRFHYQGSANHAQRLAFANNLHRTLNYKSERQGKFESFLASCKYMFFILKQHDEPMTDRAQVSYLLDKKRITNLALQNMIDILTADQLRRLNSGNDMKFDEAAGILSHTLANASSIEASPSRTVSASSSGGGNNYNNGGNSGGSGGRNGGKKGTKRGTRGGKRNGKRRKVAILGGEDIFIPGVGHIGDRGAEYAGLSQSIKDRIREERAKRGLQGGTSILRQNSAVTSTNSGSGASYNNQRHVGAVSFTGETGSGGAFGGRAQAHNQRTEA